MSVLSALRNEVLTGPPLYVGAALFPREDGSASNRFSFLAVKSSCDGCYKTFGGGDSDAGRNERRRLTVRGGVDDHKAVYDSVDLRAR